MIEIIENKLHPVFHPDPKHPNRKARLSFQLIYDEMLAAQHFGYSDYWQAERGERAMMVAFIRIREAIRAMADYDAVQRE